MYARSTTSSLYSAFTIKSPNLSLELSLGHILLGSILENNQPNLMFNKYLLNQCQFIPTGKTDLLRRVSGSLSH